MFTVSAQGILQPDFPDGFKQIKTIPDVKSKPFRM